MNYQELNKVLIDLESIRNSKKVATHVEKVINSEGQQGEEGVSYEVYKLNTVEDIYIKLTIKTDSYGENERIAGLQFVQPVIKSVTQFEPVK